MDVSLVSSSRHQRSQSWAPVTETDPDSTPAASFPPKSKTAPDATAASRPKRITGTPSKSGTWSSSFTAPPIPIHVASWHYKSRRGGQESHDVEDSLGTEQPSSPIRRFRLISIILHLSMVNFFANFSNGIIVVALPAIAVSISLSRILYIWPTSIYGLTAGSSLLLAGSVADLVGARKVDLTGVLVAGVFMLVSGFAKTGPELVVFRAVQGVAQALHLSSSVRIIATHIPAGRGRNLGFASLGMAQPLGFSMGLVLGGVMVEKVSWRLPFYLAGAATLFLALAGLWTLPPDNKMAEGQLLRRVLTEIDWVGGGIAAAGLAMLSFVLATYSADVKSMVLLGLSVVLLACFPLWMHLQKRRDRPTLIPNRLWRKLNFTSTCIMIVLSFGVLDSMELFSSLYFQQIQHTSPLFASLRLLPDLIIGAIINLSVGLFVDRLPARWLVAVSSLLCAGAPLLMALTKPKWPYWYTEFWAQVLTPFSGDVLFTVGLVIVSEVFDEETQSVAGAVFNTVAQFGQSLGVNVNEMVSMAVAGDVAMEGRSFGKYGVGSEPWKRLLRGYRASFYTMFGAMLACALIAAFGLRKVGKVGQKSG